MTLTPSPVQVAPAGGGPNVDAVQLTNSGSTTVDRQVISVGDPQNWSNVAAVKAASTAPVAADPALVVAMSPNSVMNVNDVDASVLQTGTISTPAPQTAIDTIGQDTLVIQLVGAWNGLITVEGSNDQSTGSWFQLQVMGLDELVTTDSITRSGIFVLKVATRYVRLNAEAMQGSVVTNVIGRCVVGDYGMDRLTQALDPQTGVALSVVPGLPGQQPSTRSMPVTIASDQAQDLLIVGQAFYFPSAASPAPWNVLTGNTAPIDTMAGGTTSYRSFLAQINIGAGLSQGNYIFEESNDGVSWVAVPVYDISVLTGIPVNALISPSASTHNFYSGKCNLRYLRCRSNAYLVGAVCQGFTRLSTTDLNPQILSVTQNTAGSLLCTASQGGTWTAQIGNTPNTTPILDSPCPSTSATAALSNVNVNATGALTALKASAGSLYGFSILNNTASPVYLSFWNVASGSVTLGTTAPTCVFLIPASASLTVMSPLGIMNGASAMSFACVTGYNGSTTASITGSIFYK